MSTTQKVYKKVHFMNISDSGGDQISLVGKVRSFDRTNRKLLLEVLGKEFEINNVDSKKKLEKGTKSRSSA